MASKQPVHGGSAQSKEFDIDLLVKVIHWTGDSETAEAIISVGANGTLHVDMLISNSSTNLAR